jgi:sedoheptulokinase
MSRICIAGIDFGTTTLSAILVDIEKQQIVHSITIRTDACIQFPEALFKKEQNIDVLEKCFYKLIHEIFSIENTEIKSIGFTGQMHGIVGLDKSMKPVTNLITWQDDRGSEKTANGKMLLDEIKEISGNQFLSNGYGIIAIYNWLRKENRKDIHTFCTIPDYFAMLFAKAPAPVMDYSMAHSIGCLDIQNNSWDAEMIKELDLNPDIFPLLKNSDTLIGNMDLNQYSKDQIPVSIAIGDNQASFSGSIKDFNSSVLINVGTGSQISFAIHKKDYLKYKIKVNGFDSEIRPFNREWSLFCVSFTSGGTVYHALYNFFLECGIQLFGLDKNAVSEKLWETMAVCASNANQNEGFKVKPLFNGMRSNPRASGTIEGITQNNLKPSVLIRETLTGLATYYKDMLHDFIPGSINCYVGSGNGIKKNMLFYNSLKEVFNSEIFLTRFDEEAAMGAAINGAIASGIYKNIEESRGLISHIIPQK